MSRQLSEKSGESLWYQMSLQIEKLMSEQKSLKPNVDFYSASVYKYLGLNEEFYTPIFAMSRVVGWTAHVVRTIRR